MKAVVWKLTSIFGGCDNGYQL